MTPLEQGIFEAINQHRTRVGLRALVPDSTLVAAAREHSAAMSRLGFFDHTSPAWGRETPALRAKAANAEFVAIGENLAAHSPELAMAEEFLRGWLNSPPHRDNLLKAEWECSGVGVHVGPSMVHVTQLFSILPDIRLDAPQLVRAGDAVVSLRASFELERPGELGVLVSGTCVASAVSDARGQVVAEAAIPASWAREEVSLAMRLSTSEDTWAELVSGRAARRLTGRWRWRHERGPFAGVRQWSIDVSRDVSEAHQLWLRGETRRSRTLVVTVDGYVQQTHAAEGAFALLHRIEPAKGVRYVTLGVQISGSLYQPVRGFKIDTDAATLADAPGFDR